MANHTVQLNSLQPNTTFMVRGRLTYCKVTSRIDGEQLRQKMENQRARGMIVIDKPHTTASIKNAKVLYKNTDSYGNPTQKLPEEIYAEESLWASKKNPQDGLCFAGINKGTQLPMIGELQADGHTVQGVNPEGELANDLDVTLVMRIFRPKGQINNGVALDGIIVNEPIRYYDGNAFRQNMQDMGLTWKPAPPKTETENAEANNTPAQQAQAPQPATAEGPFESGQAMNRPISAPTGYPYSTNGNQYNAAGQTDNQYQPAPNAQTAEPAPGYYGGPEAAPQGAGQPVRQAAPGYRAENNTSGGIHYTGADRQY